VQGRVRPGAAIISTTNTNLNVIIVIAILLFLILVVLVWGRNAATGLMEFAALGVVGLIVLVILALLGLEAWDYMQHHPEVRELRDGRLFEFPRSEEKKIELAGAMALASGR
jgi:amino acid transporter